MQELADAVVREATLWAGAGIVAIAVAALAHAALRLQGAALTGNPHALGAVVTTAALVFGGLLVVWFAPSLVNGLAAALLEPAPPEVTR